MKKSRLIIATVLFVLFYCIGTAYGMAVVLSHGRTFSSSNGIVLSLINIICGAMALIINRNVDEDRRRIYYISGFLGLFLIAGGSLTILFVVLFPNYFG